MARKKGYNPPRSVRRLGSIELPLEGEIPPSLVPTWKQYFEQDYLFQGIAGHGKTGIAYRILRRNSAITFCLKTLRPEVASKDAIAEFGDSLIKEVEILRPLSHRCLPAIFDFRSDAAMPYYVCTFHSGITVEEFVRRDLKLGVHESFYAVSSLLSVLEYLHSQGRPHCDLHTKNVMIDSDIFRHGILVIDFGSGHRDSDPRPLTPNRGIAFVKDTEDKSRYQQMVPRAEMSTGFRHADFRALGTLLGTLAGSFFVESSAIQAEAYLAFCHALTAGTIRDWPHARERLLSVMDPMRKLTIFNRLFEDSRGQPQSIPLPVSRLVLVGERPLAIINTAAFQNLRRLTQLSFCEWRFPGAIHTRFEHSLGVFNLVRKALTSLCNDVRFRDHYTVAQMKGCLLAGLLHDVGHYPLAHIVEQFAAGGRLHDDPTIRADIHHSARTKFLIEKDEELSGAIKKHWGEEAQKTCVEILDGKHSLLASLISGAIDCDKMDYLTRDALHCGLRVGRGLDTENLLANLRPSIDGKEIAIAEAGVSAVEGLMVLQHQMLSAVYWHRTIRGIICMVHAALAHITKTDANVLRTLSQELITTRTVREATERVLLPALSKLGRRAFLELSPLVNLHVTPRYTEIFRSIRTYRISDERQEGEAVSIYSSINRRSESASTASVQPVDWPNVGKLRKAFRTAFQEKGMTVKGSDVIIDVPLGKSAHHSVPVQREDGSECDIVEISHLNPTIFEQPAIFESPIRVYISPNLYSRTEHSLDSIIISAEEQFHHPPNLATSRE